MKTAADLFTVVVELFGHRDLAADDPADFHGQTELFQETLKTSLAENDFPRDQCLLLLDKCLLWHASPTVLLDLLTDLRRRLMLVGESALLLRGVMLGKAVGVQITAPSSTSQQGQQLSVSDGPGLILDAAGWELFGRVEIFKGIGIWIDDTVLSHSALSPAERDEIGHRVCRNYYIPDAHKQTICPFTDLKFVAEHLIYQGASNVISLIREAYHDHPKLLRFFVPLLVNWIQHMDLKGRAQPKSRNRKGMGLDFFVTRGDFKVLRRVNGVDLVMSKLIDRLMTDKELLSKTELPAERWSRLYDYLLRSVWTANIIQADGGRITVPDDILPRRRRRAFSKDLASRAHAGHIKVKGKVEGQKSSDAK